MEEAINVAIEKGGHVNHYSEWDDNVLTDTMIANDPLFFQALGRALGWYGSVLTGFNSSGVGVKQDKWLFHALDYFELKLTGGDEAKFWKELLTNRERE